jgi:hypothetical protein
MEKCEDMQLFVSDLFVFLIKQISTPQAKTTSPTIEIANPFTVHSGLLYIKEDFGPTIELLCAINTIPAIRSIHPTTIKILTKIGFLILMQILLIQYVLRP